MSDRKYRQHGYQDETEIARAEARRSGRHRSRARPGGSCRMPAGPKTPNLMASHEVFRCARCGNLLGVEVAIDARCARCGVDLHACIQCVSFDTSARFECSQSALTARVAPKDARNRCALFAPRTTIERQTGDRRRPPSARQAFDDLFK